MCSVQFCSLRVCWCVPGERAKEFEDRAESHCAVACVWHAFVDLAVFGCVLWLWS